MLAHNTGHGLNVSPNTLLACLRSFIVAGSCALTFSPSLRATQLVFEQSRIESELPIDNQEAKAVFLFKNTSQSTVRVLEVRTECDCIQTSMPTHGIEAGKTGEITLRFRSKLRNGTDVVRATVVTDSNETHEISVSTKLRSYIEAKPLSLHWLKGGIREAKEFIVSSTGCQWPLQNRPVVATSKPATLRVDWS